VRTILVADEAAPFYVVKEARPRMGCGMGLLVGECFSPGLTHFSFGSLNEAMVEDSLNNGNMDPKVSSLNKKEKTVICGIY
jgi:hypothetical protein